MFYRKSPQDQQAESDRQPTDFETQDSLNPTCFEVHEKWQVGCDQTQCRNWMDFGEDLNCAVVCSRKHENGQALEKWQKEWELASLASVKLSTLHLGNLKMQEFLKKNRVFY